MDDVTITKDERAMLAAAALASDLSETPRLLVTITDEELLALAGPEEDEAALPWTDALRTRLPEYTVEDAVQTGSRILLARGMVAPEAVLARLEERSVIGDPETVRPSLLLTGVVARRALSPRRVSLRPEQPEGARFVVLHVDADGSVLQEQVSENGLHHFLMQDTASARRTISGLLDPPDEAAGLSADPAEARVVTGRWGEVRERLDVDDSALLVRIDVHDRPLRAQETLWWLRQGSSVHALRGASEGGRASLEHDDLEVASLGAGEREDLLAELLG
ncbi:hypothetical protein ACT3TZ_06855 [Brachybacterium sp. AOP25-B2-12]|uniref:hypothetical protein n=1 Tax=Brachybacterium sp. AOP25-B2-12 TaxID=3457710 RepID=UPI0040338D75